MKERENRKKVMRKKKIRNDSDGKGGAVNGSTPIMTPKAWRRPRKKELSKRSLEKKTQST